jgi:hypothetical protein
VIKPQWSSIVGFELGCHERGVAVEFIGCRDSGPHISHRAAYGQQAVPPRQLDRVGITP